MIVSLRNTCILRWTIMADAPLITVAIQFGHEASNLGKLDRFYGNLNSHGIVLINLMNYDTKTSRKLKN